MKGFRQYKYDILCYISNPASTISYLRNNSNNTAPPIETIAILLLLFVLSPIILVHLYIVIVTDTG